MKDAFDIDDWKEADKALLERDIERPSVAKARATGWWVKKFKSPAQRSAPDDVFAKPGRRGFYVEFKRPGGKATEKQEKYHEEMRAAGLIVWVCDTREMFDYILALEDQMYVRHERVLPAR